MAEQVESPSSILGYAV